MNTYLLDTSALLTLRDNEAGADSVEDILQKAKKGSVKVFVSFMTFTEIFYIVCSVMGKRKLIRSIYSLRHFR